MYSSSAEQDRRTKIQALAEQLYRERYDYLLQIAVKHAANRDDAADSVQFAFLAFVEKFDPASGSPPLGWLTLTLERRCWALYRLQRRGWSQRSERDGEGCSDAEFSGRPSQHPDDLLDLAEEIAAMRSYLAALKPAERRTLSLIAAGYSYREIGQITGFTYTKVNRCLAEGRARIRQLAAG